MDHDPHQTDAILALYRQGYSQKEVARQLDTNQMKVRRTLLRNGVPLRATAENTPTARKPYAPRKVPRLEDYDALLARQGGCCAICAADTGRPGTRDRFAIDHDHDTGEVRGLLCNACNVGLGYFRDDPRLLAAAMLYLTQPPALLK